MKSTIVLFLYLIGTLAYANGLGIQYDQTDGNGSLGFGYYSNNFAVSLSINGLNYSDGPETSYWTPFLFAELKKEIDSNTHFGYGVNYHQTFGDDNGEEIRDYSLGPHLSISHKLLDKLLIMGWVNPYEYRFIGRKTSSGTTGNSIAAYGSGGLRLVYFY